MQPGIIVQGHQLVMQYNREGVKANTTARESRVLCIEGPEHIMTREFVRAILYFIFAVVKSTAQRCRSKVLTSGNCSGTTTSRSFARRILIGSLTIPVKLRGDTSWSSVLCVLKGNIKRSESPFLIEADLQNL